MKRLLLWWMNFLILIRLPILLSYTLVDISHHLEDLSSIIALMLNEDCHSVQYLFQLSSFQSWIAIFLQLIKHFLLHIITFVSKIAVIEVADIILDVPFLKLWTRFEHFLRRLHRFEIAKGLLLCQKKKGTYISLRLRQCRY